MTSKLCLLLNDEVTMNFRSFHHFLPQHYLHLRYALYPKGPTLNAFKYDDTTIEIESCEFKKFIIKCKLRAG